MTPLVEGWAVLEGLEWCAPEPRPIVVRPDRRGPRFGGGTILQ